MVTSLDPATHTATLRDGGTINYDLFLGVPVHRAPAVVEESGLAVDGWIPVDHTTFATQLPERVRGRRRHERAGAARRRDRRRRSRHRRRRARSTGCAAATSPPPYPGIATCYVEFGGAEVAKFDVNFLGGPSPFAVFNQPSVELAASKKEFGATRRHRWFGQT